MSNEKDLLNMNDPFDVHAYFLCGFTCNDCEAEVVPDSGCDGCADKDCRHLSDKAKALGWYVPPPEPPDNCMDIETCYCPTCAHRRGLGFL